jgi:hypothetical protein
MSRKSQEEGDKEGGIPSSRGLLQLPSSPLLQPLRPAPECVLKHVDRLPPGGVHSSQQFNMILLHQKEIYLRERMQQCISTQCSDV